MNTAPRNLTIGLAIISLPLVLSCTSSQEQGVDPIEPEVFVSVMANLSQVYQFPPDGSGAEDREARADSLRQSILRQHGISAEQLLAFADQVGRDPSRMEELAEQIAVINDSLTAQRDPAEDATEVPTSQEVSESAGAPPPPSPGTEADNDKSFRNRLDSLRQEFGRTRP
jgi:hypothetical protein